MGSLAAIVVVYTDLTHWLHDVDTKMALAAKVCRELVPWMFWDKGDAESEV